jgi:hypothetical protein
MSLAGGEDVYEFLCNLPLVRIQNMGLSTVVDKNNWLIPRNRVYIEEQISPQSRSSPHFMETNSLLLSTQEPATCSYRGPD